MTTDYIGRDRRRSTFQVELARLQPRGIAACSGQRGWSAPLLAPPCWRGEKRQWRWPERPHVMLSALSASHKPAISNALAPALPPRTPSCPPPDQSSKY